MDENLHNALNAMMNSCRECLAAEERVKRLKRAYEAAVNELKALKEKDERLTQEYNALIEEARSHKESIF